MNKTKQVLQEMFKEEVPRSFLDSGGRPKYDEDGNYVGSEGGYGRNYERNRNLTSEDFEKSPASEINIEDYNGNAHAWVIHNTYHWLLDRAEVWYAPEADKQFHEWAEGRETSWLVDMEKYASEYLEADGPFGGEPMTVNTYNHDSALGQVIQYVLFYGDLPTEDGETMSDVFQVLLQVHGGCDVRGGYTSPRLFTLWEDAILCDADAGIYCDECGARWSSDDNYHFYASCYSEPTAIFDLGEYGIAQIEEEAFTQAKNKVKEEKEKRQQQTFFCDPGPIPKKRIMKEVAGIEPGDVVVLEDAKDKYGDYAVCPVCLRGRLMPCF